MEPLYEGGAPSEQLVGEAILGGGGQWRGDFEAN